MGWYYKFYNKKWWNKLLSEIDHIVDNNQISEISSGINEILLSLHNIPGCTNCDESDVTKWFENNEGA